MAGTADVNDKLDLGRRGLDELGEEVVTHSTWRPSPGGKAGDFYLELELRPDGLTPGGPVAPSTRWIALVQAAYPLGRINLMPAAEGGIEETYPHQLANEPVEPGLPWRSGKVCLVDTIHGHQLAAKREDPTDAYGRLAWHVALLLGWLRHASAGTLLADGQPFELPIFGQFQVVGPRIGFYEGAEAFEFWSGRKEHFGLAKLAAITNDILSPVFAVRAWLDESRNQLMAPAWGELITASKNEEEALWFRFDRPLVLAPWRSPQTIGQLLEGGQEQGVDIMAGLTRARPLLTEKGGHQILFGFPIPAIVGAEASRMQWVSFRLRPLTSGDRRGKKDPIVPGFRNKTGAWYADRLPGGQLANDQVIDWSFTQNWAPEELAARGRFEGNLAAGRVALIGAGALGSVIGNLLVRGGVRDLVVVDGGVMEAPNLSRHELGIADVGQSKAVALAKQLNTRSPTARVLAIDEDFPVRTDTAKELADVGLVIDATASEAVITALGGHEFPDRTRFASVSFSFDAQRLYFFTAVGARFPAADFVAKMEAWLAADARPASDFPHEGTGCWSSVFPARADHVDLLAAIVAGRIDNADFQDVAQPVLTVFERQDDGTVTIIAAP